MMEFIQTAVLPSQRARGRANVLRGRCVRLLWCLAALFTAGAAPAVRAQGGAMTGAQELAFASLRSVQTAGIPAGQINSVTTDGAGNIFLLIDQKDGVRLLKTDAAGEAVLAQAQMGATGDIGLAMALDPSGNIYVTGTTSSGALTATGGAAFPTPTGMTANGFVAKFDGDLHTYFVTFAGAGSMSAGAIAATADAVFIGGTIFSPGLPVTAQSFEQAPAQGTTQNGFVEEFSASGSALLYATYLSGAGGNTTVNALTVDATGDAYAGGYTAAAGYPTAAAVVPEMIGTGSGFVTKLTPAGDGISFSTFIPGAGISSLAIDQGTGDLLLSGAVSLGEFPVAAVAGPLVPLPYQVLVRMPLDGSTVLSSTALAPGNVSFVTAGGSGTAWVDGDLAVPLLPVMSLSSVGNSYAARVSPAGIVDQTARFGGVAASNTGYASAPVSLTSIAVNAAGEVMVGGSFSPTASASLLATETFDLPLEPGPTPAFPDEVHAAVLPASACGGSLCAGSAAYLAKLVTPASASATRAALALSIDDAPNLTLRNLSTAQATGVQIATSGFTEADNCGATLPAGGECSIALSGSGPGSVVISAANGDTQTRTMPALPSSAVQAGVVFSPKELDFGIVSAAGAGASRTITVTNLTQQTQTFNAARSVNPRSTPPYTFAEQATDCTLAGSTNRLLAPGGSCHITVSLAPSSSAANDGIIRANWLIGAGSVALTAYAQAAAVSVSANEVDFGMQYTSGLRLPRYLYLSNSSTQPFSHAAVLLPSGSPFTVSDGCPSVLLPGTVCRIDLRYQAAHAPSTDTVTLALDDGLSVLVTGRTLSQQGAAGATANPNLTVSATSLAFATPVAVTTTSSSTQTSTITNAGGPAFALSSTLTGDYTEATNCGATLVGGASCSMVFTLAPSGPGTRNGLLTLSAGAGSAPVYVTLTGVGSDILFPANNGAIDLGMEPVGQPVVQWFKVTQPFTSFAAATASSLLGTPFSAVLVEDIGYGHGQPAAALFSNAVSGSCFNCWLGVRFDPVAAGAETGTLTLRSATQGNAYVVSLSGTSSALSGVLLTPASQDFGLVAVNSISPASLFVVTNLSATGTAVTLGAPQVSGDFLISGAPSGGPACGGLLPYTASCFVELAFAPVATGARSGAMTIGAGSSSISVTLTGYGAADPGVALNPSALVFSEVPGSASMQQVVSVRNMGAAALVVGTPSATTNSTGQSFAATSDCGTLSAGSACTVVVKFSPSSAQVTGTLTIPVTNTTGSSPAGTNYTIPLTGAYTTASAGLQILPGEVQFGPLATGTLGTSRQFTVNNLSGKVLALKIALPRQFALSGSPCTSLAAGASCTFAVGLLPLTNGTITGTIVASGTPNDGSSTANAAAYLEGYGNGPGTLSVTGGLLPGTVLDFGQVASGQFAGRVLTLTNTSTIYPLTVRRITGQSPFTATSTCGATLAPTASCTVALSYAPLNQVAPGVFTSPSRTDTATLVIESDAASSPDAINLTGSVTPVTVGTPTTVTLAALTASQSSLTFAATQAGDVAVPQVVTLSNTGTGAVHILNLQSTPDFTVTSDCATILPGAHCNVTVQFTPQATSQLGAASITHVGAIEISSDAITPLEFLSVIGVATPSALALSQTSLNFGPVQVGNKGSYGLQVTNTGGVAITFGALTATGDYTVSTGSCPLPGAVLPPSTSCTLQVGFAPTATGVRPGVLSVASSATTLPLTVALTGLGVQSHLQSTPSRLNFGPIATGAAASLTLMLANTGSAAISGLALTATAGYSVSTPCAVSTLAAGASCQATITFSPTAVGQSSGVLTVLSSDTSSPASILLAGSGISNAAFTLTVSGGLSTGSGSARTGRPASYALTITPLNGFSGAVILNCTPMIPADFGYCSLLPSMVTLNGTAQNAVATLETVTSIADSREPPHRGFGETAICLLFPALLFSWKAKTSSDKTWRRTMPFAWGVFASVALLLSSGCAGSGADPNLRYATPGSYQYQVSASSVSGGVQMTQTVTLNLTITR